MKAGERFCRGCYLALFPLGLATAERRTAVILAVAIVGVGPLAWALSLVMEPLLIPRYFVPAVWAWAIFGAALWVSLGPPAARIVDVRDASRLIEPLAAGELLALLRRARGWRKAIACREIYHPYAGLGVIEKFTRPAPSPGKP